MSNKYYAILIGAPEYTNWGAGPDNIIVWSSPNDVNCRRVRGLIQSRLYSKVVIKLIDKLYNRSTIVNQEAWPTAAGWAAYDIG
jgi:hypothetical protein